MEYPWSMYGVSMEHLQDTLTFEQPLSRSCVGSGTCLAPYFLYLWTMEEFIERNKLVRICLYAGAGLAALVALILQFAALPEALQTDHYFIGYILAVCMIVPALLFQVMTPRVIVLREEDEDVTYLAALSRNAWLFTVIMLIVALVTFSSTADRISRFFFIITAMSYITAVITHSLTLNKLRRNG